jgi:hypothetical protein
MSLWPGRAILCTFLFLRTKFFISETSLYTITAGTYMGADKSLAPPGRKQVTGTEDFNVHMSYLLS